MNLQGHIATNQSVAISMQQIFTYGQLCPHKTLQTCAGIALLSHCPILKADHLFTENPLQMAALPNVTAILPWLSSGNGTPRDQKFSTRGQ